MIFVRRDSSIIPDKLFRVAERAQSELEELSDPLDRREFIKKKSAIWRSFARYLSRMSYGKCWYSESPDPQSFFDVDHFRPKLEAKRTETDTDNPGYEWLCFNWENFRYAANCSNRLVTNHETGEVDGKGSWFPLLEGSVKANWNHRCESEESPILIDPCEAVDMNLLEVGDDGHIVPSRVAVGSAALRVRRSAEIYGLNLPRIKGARAKVMRDIRQQVAAFEKSLEAATSVECSVRVADAIPIQDQFEIIRAMTSPDSPYSLAARAELQRLGRSELCLSPEQCPSI